MRAKPLEGLLLLETRRVEQHPVTWLDEEERSRAARFRHALDRRRYIAAHVALRELLAPFVDCGPAELTFARQPCPACGGPHGRPALADAPSVHFSLSYASDQLAVAIADRPVGVDIETSASVPAAADLYAVISTLHPDEVTELLRLPADAVAAGFLACWTRKEAWLKAVGTGIASGLDGATVGVARPVSPPGWVVDDVPAADGYRAAVALSAVPTNAPEAKKLQHS